MRLSDVLIEYLETNPRITSSETGRRYRTTINSLERHLARAATVEDLNPETYGRWVNARRAEVATNTVAGDAEKLLVLWAWAARRGMCDPPSVAVPSKQTRAPIAYTDEEVSRIWRAAVACRWTVGGAPGSIYWPALICTLYQTAERIQAIHALTAQDIDLERRCVMFRAETRKGRTSDALRPIDRAAAARIRELLAIAPARPFAVVRYKTLYPAYRRLLCEARVDLSRQKMFHAWRRRHASDLTRAGIDATVALGHSSRNVTLRSYVDPSISLAHSPLATLRPLGRGWRGWVGWVGRLLGAG